MSSRVTPKSKQSLLYKSSAQRKRSSPRKSQYSGRIRWMKFINACMWKHEQVSALSLSTFLTRSYSMCYIGNWWVTLSTSTSRISFTPEMLLTRPVEIYCQQRHFWHQTPSSYNLRPESPSPRNSSPKRIKTDEKSYTGQRRETHQAKGDVVVQPYRLSCKVFIVGQRWRQQSPHMSHRALILLSPPSWSPQDDKKPSSTSSRWPNSDELPSDSHSDFYLT